MDSRVRFHFGKVKIGATALIDQLQIGGAKVSNEQQDEKSQQTFWAL
jgi:hypothetical protein